MKNLNRDGLQALQCNDLTWLLWRLGLMVAMTTNSCCYDNMSRLLWRYVVVAMGIDGGLLREQGVAMH